MICWQKNPNDFKSDEQNEENVEDTIESERTPKEAIHELTPDKIKRDEVNSEYGETSKKRDTNRSDMILKLENNIKETAWSPRLELEKTTPFSFRKSGSPPKTPPNRAEEISLISTSNKSSTL